MLGHGCVTTSHIKPWDLITNPCLDLSEPILLKGFPCVWGSADRDFVLNGMNYPTKTRFVLIVKTHWGRVTHICVSNLTIIVSDNGLSPGRRQAIILPNAGIVNWTLRNKLQWNFNRNSNVLIQENAFENVVCEMASIVSRSQCVKRWIILPFQSCFSGIWIRCTYRYVIVNRCDYQNSFRSLAMGEN